MSVSKCGGDPSTQRSDHVDFAERVDRDPHGENCNCALHLFVHAPSRGQATAFEHRVTPNISPVGRRMTSLAAYNIAPTFNG
jgi:hypothetical protein